MGDNTGNDLIRRAPARFECSTTDRMFPDRFHHETSLHLLCVWSAHTNQRKRWLGNPFPSHEPIKHLKVFAVLSYTELGSPYWKRVSNRLRVVSSGVVYDQAHRIWWIPVCTMDQFCWSKCHPLEIAEYVNFAKDTTLSWFYVCLWSVK